MFYDHNHGSVILASGSFSFSLGLVCYIYIVMNVLSLTRVKINAVLTIQN